MTSGQVERGLDQLLQSFRRARILADGADTVIDQAKAQVRSSAREYQSRVRRTDDPQLEILPWGYSIAPRRPLSFRRVDTDSGFDARADVYGTVKWRSEHEMPVRQCIHLRVWNEGDCFRPEWDARTLEESLCDPQRKPNGRVMLRMHFDRADADGPGPRYHLQFGGSAEPDEMCWFPEPAKLPRLAHPPMDLLLTCQLVAANFFRRQYVENLVRDPQWRGVVGEVQKELLLPYYRGCAEVVKAEQASLLDSLWEVRPR